MKQHERTPLVPIARADGRVALRLRRPPLPRRGQLVVGQPVRPRESAHQRGDHRAARRARARDARRLHAPAGDRALRAAGGARACRACRTRSTVRRRIGDRDRAEDELPLLAPARRTRQGRVTRGSPAAITARRVGALASPTSRCFATRTRRCCARTRCCRRPRARDAADATAAQARASTTRWRRSSAFSSSTRATTAALIVEPLVQGAARHGDVRRRATSPRARALTRRHDVHLIADEIMTGFGRTGTMFACEQAGDHAGLPVPVERHHRRLPAAVVRARDRRGLRRVLRRRRRARLPAFAFVHRQRARLPRGAGGARHLPRRRRHRRRTATTASRWRSIAAPLAAHPRVRDFRQCGMILAFDVARRERPDFARWFAARGTASASCCCARSAAPSTSCRRTSLTDDEFALLVERTLDDPR